TDSTLEDRSSQNLQQQYTLSFRQELSPFLAFLAQYNHLDLQTSPSDADSSRRRLRQPQLNLLYSRPKVTARLGYNYRYADGTFDAANFESQGFDGTLFWQALANLSFNLSYRDDVNETDVQALGRNTRTQQARATVRYARAFWSTSYSFSSVDLENRSTGLTTDQNRHDFRISGARDFDNQRLTLSALGLAGISDRRQSVPGDADLAEPIPAVAGLFAIDLTPGLGELEPSPGLIDGDFQTPVAPPIQIGAANTFRNVGLDLGITRPISRLEVTVDEPSGPNLAWNVYQSRDNLFWEPVAGAQSTFDEDLLQYTIQFPETENRFFKVVNVSINTAPRVAVTEMRALLDIEGILGDSVLDSDIYRADFSARYRISSKVQADAAIGANNDQTTVAGIVRQDNQVNYANAGLNIDFTDTLGLDFSYRLTDSTDERRPTLDRSTEELGANLFWTPLPTVDVVATAGIREESDPEDLIQRTTLSRLRVDLQLLTDLGLVSVASYSRVEDPFSGFDRDTFTWLQRLEASPLRTWFFELGYDYSLTETPEMEALLERSNVYLRTRWTPGANLSVNGVWRYYQDDFSDSLRQNYGIVYTPGPKLSFTAAIEQFDSQTGRATSNGSLGFSYRMYSRVLITGNLFRSTFDQPSGTSEKINSAQLGLTIGF
ncbi:MAG: hypothetical protein P8Y44_09585, partial [Acidobacteriota bacterium]